MKRLLLALLFAPLLAQAGPVVIGGTPYDIPPPAGYAEISMESPMVKEALAPTADGLNVAFAHFVSVDDAVGAMEGEVPVPERRFSVQTMKEWEDAPVSQAQFWVFKTVFGAVSQQAAGDKGGEHRKFQMLPPHENTSDALAFSVVANHPGDTDWTRNRLYGAVTSVEVLHLKGKLVFLYCRGGEHDLEWTRSAVKAWAQTVRARNPMDTASVVRQSVPFTIPDIDWARYGPIALVVLGLWMLAALGVWFAVRPRGQDAG